MSEEAEKLQKLVVMPESVGSLDKTDPPDSLRHLIDFIKQKTQQSIKGVEATSAVSFMANHLQNRQLVTEFSVSLAKFYNDLGVTSETACTQKLEELGKTDEEIAALLPELEAAWKEWEEFLEGVDRAVEAVAGPNSPKSISSADNIKVATKGKGAVQSGTLLSYVQNSPFQLMLIEVIWSFAPVANHVLSIYEKLPAFHAPQLRHPPADQLVGVPFRLLLDEQESLSRILQHRQSAVVISGQKTIHLLAEISSTGATLDEKSGFDKNGGVCLLDHAGNVEKNRKTDENAIKQTTVENGKPVESKDTNVTVGKRRCCAIM
ncbi:hypothetical protein M3Y99_00844900 [Aphelenchoides fujianensis]|nr:hypothetical protein M3Y99_00844900 [Aphelenchoides fujianensis]